MIESILGFFARLVWLSLTLWLGYWTGRATIQVLSLGRLDVAEYGNYNQNPFKLFWYRGGRPVVSFLAAIALGQFLWFGLFFGIVIYLSRG
ncbi:hypothetical protein ACWIGM_05115 [Bosea sp. NPDC055332]